MEDKFCKDLDELALQFKAQKCHVLRFVKKHFTEGFHYIKEKPKRIFVGRGRNAVRYMLTEDVYELINSTYNLRRRNPQGTENIQFVNTLIMDVENASIGFLCNCLKGITETIRQYHVGGYKIDLYLPEYKIAIECDEFGHNHYDQVIERCRESFIKQRLNCQFIRYDPTEDDFDLSQLVNEVFRLLK